MNVSEFFIEYLVDIEAKIEKGLVPLIRGQGRLFDEKKN
jgi:hypothetical protein